MSERQHPSTASSSSSNQSHRGMRPRPPTARATNMGRESHRSQTPTQSSYRGAGLSSYRGAPPPQPRNPRRSSSGPDDGGAAERQPTLATAPSLPPTTVLASAAPHTTVFATAVAGAQAVATVVAIAVPLAPTAVVSHNVDAHHVGYKVDGGRSVAVSRTVYPRPESGQPLASALHVSQRSTTSQSTKSPSRSDFSVRATLTVATGQPAPKESCLAPSRAGSRASQSPEAFLIENASAIRNRIFGTAASPEQQNMDRTSMLPPPDSPLRRQLIASASASSPMSMLRRTMPLDTITEVNEQRAISPPPEVPVTAIAGEPEAPAQVAVKADASEPSASDVTQVTLPSIQAILSSEHLAREYQLLLQRPILASTTVPASPVITKTDSTLSISTTATAIGAPSLTTASNAADDRQPSRGLEAENARLRMEVHELRTVLAKCESTTKSNSTQSKSISLASPMPMTPEMQAYVVTGSSIAAIEAEQSAVLRRSAVCHTDQVAATTLRPVILAPTVEKMRLHDLEEHRRLLAARVIQAMYREWKEERRRRRQPRGTTNDKDAVGRSKQKANEKKSMGQLALAARMAAKNKTEPITADSETELKKRVPTRASRYMMAASTFVSSKGRDADISQGRLERIVGIPPALVFNAMEREHASETPFSSFSIDSTTPRAEWMYVLFEEVGSRPDRVHDCTPERVGWRLQDFVLCDTARRASLTLEEVIAIRLYTGPMSEWYNYSLRDRRKDEFTATIHTINSAIVKLSTLQHAATVYRLMTITKPIDQVFAIDESGSCCGFEVGFLSTTSSRNVALRLSETRVHKLAPVGKRPSLMSVAKATKVAAEPEKRTVLMRLRVVPFDHAGDVSFASQVPAEGEIVFAPLTTLEVVSFYEDDGVIIADVRARRSHPARTTTQTIGRMKATHVDLVDIMLDELKAAGAPEPSLLPLACLQSDRKAEERSSQYNLPDTYVEYTANALQVHQRVLRQLSAASIWADTSGKDAFNRMIGVIALQAQTGEIEAAIELAKLAFKKSGLNSEITNLPEELGRDIEWAEKVAVSKKTNQAMTVIKPSDVKKMFSSPVQFILEAALYFFSLGATQPWPPLIATLLSRLTPAGYVAWGELMRMHLDRQKKVINTNVLVWNEKTKRWQQGVMSGSERMVRYGHEERGADSIKHLLYPVDAGIGALFNEVVCSGDETLVSTLLEAKASMLYSDERANSTLHLAVAKGKSNVCKLLLKVGADMTLPNADGLTPWDLALRSSNRAVATVLNPGAVDLDLEGQDTPSSALGGNQQDKDLVRDLLKFAIACDKERMKKVIESATGKFGEMNGFVDMPNKDEVTPLMFAAHSDAEDALLCTRILMERGASQLKISRRGCTALMMAAAAGNIPIVNILLHHRAQIDRKCSGGYTALHLAIEYGHAEVATNLIIAGADVHTRLDNGWSCLMTAAHCGTAGVLKSLIEKPDDANVTFTPPNVDKQSGEFAPIHMAAFHGFASTLTELVRLGAAIDLPMKNGWTALMIAALQGHKAASEALLQSGAHIDLQSPLDGTTPLMAAVSNPYTADCVGLLLQASASVNLRDGMGLDALMFACRNGHTPVVQQLLRQRADVKHARPGGTTALMDAAASGSHAIVRLLLNANAELGATDDYGMNALMHSAKAGHEETMLPLLIAGADVAAKDKSSRSALSLAPSKQVARRLLEAGADAAHLPVAFCDALGLSAADGEHNGAATAKNGTAGQKASGAAKAASTRGSVVGAHVSNRNVLSNSASKGALSGTRGRPDLGKVQGGAVDFFAAAPPDMSGKVSKVKQDVSRPKPTMADDPVCDIHATALKLIKVLPPVRDEMPLLNLTTASASGKELSAALIVQRAFRALKRYKRKEARLAFYQPKGMMGLIKVMKTSGLRKEAEPGGK